MVDMGTEVGQKMRSAIKAKLTELECYVDDELPDYIMVMIANQRSKSEMNHDLNLFLNTKTSIFVDWLHIVLKKLKEVTVTNPDVYKKVIKKKNSVKVKKEKKDKKIKIVKLEKIKEELLKDIKNEKNTSLTDDLPINVRKVSVLPSQLSITSNSNNFDIPPISDINEPENEDFSRTPPLRNKPNENELEFSKNLKIIDPDQLTLEKPESTKERARIVFAKSDFEDKDSSRKRSVMDRLGKRMREDGRDDFKRRRRDLSEERVLRRRSPLKRSNGPRRSPLRSKSPVKSDRRARSNERDLRKTLVKNRVETKAKVDVKKRLGVQSKISVPEDFKEEKLVKKDVVSVIKVKPRVLPPTTAQANKNLLLKAVADAQKSVAQTKLVGRNVLEQEEIQEESEPKNNIRKIPPEAKEILRNFLFNHRLGKIGDLNEDEQEYIPQPIKRTPSNLEYVPGIRNEDYSAIKFSSSEKGSVKSRLDARKTPSPIIFEAKQNNFMVKNKERCKYWPGCKNGDKCDFVHPSKSCEMFPYCKFGEKCLFLHPACKFGASCTKRDCCYSHTNPGSNGNIVSPAKLNAGALTCKFLQNCANISCPYFHPKLCKFGKFCKNPGTCGFLHNAFQKKHLKWKSF